MGGKQLVFSDYELTTAKKQTKREKFLTEMEAVMPWQVLVDLIDPYYPKTIMEGGRPPYPLATILRIHLLQKWFSLSGPAMEVALIELSSMCRFAGIELMSDRIPNETKILAFRYLPGMSLSPGYFSESARKSLISPATIGMLVSWLHF